MSRVIIGEKRPTPVVYSRYNIMKFRIPRMGGHCLKEEKSTIV